MNQTARRSLALLLAVAVSGCSTSMDLQTKRARSMPGARHSSSHMAPGMMPQQLAMAPAQMARPQYMVMAQQMATRQTPLPAASLPTPDGIQLATYVTAPTPRRQACPPPAGQCPPMEVVGDSGLVDMYPDEYLFDGGDRGARVHYRANERLGVETEDTFAEYTDETGKQHVRPSNCVAIYSPRFAAVRSISGPDIDTKVDRLAMARDTQGGSAFHGRTIVGTEGRRSRAGGMRTRSRASAVDGEAPGRLIAARSRAKGNVHYLKPLKRTQALAGMSFNLTNEAWLATQMQAAMPWTRNAYPVIQAVTAGAMEVEASYKPQQHIGIEEKQAPGQLRIIKLADRKTAVPGDVITFTLQFENIGDRELFDVRIIDNLTPRLEYIEDSAGSDLAGNVIAEDNDEGSKVLRFEIDGSLKGGAKGVVTFKARVR